MRPSVRGGLRWGLETGEIAHLLHRCLSLRKIDGSCRCGRQGCARGGEEMLAEVVLSSSPSSQLAAGFPRCHARPRMRDSNEIMPALVFKYENAHIEFLITHTIGLK